MLKKQVRLYLVVLPDQRILCPAKSAEHVQSFLPSIDCADIYYLGWAEMALTDHGYKVCSPFTAQENADLLTGEEERTYRSDEDSPLLIQKITEFLDEYYYEERLTALAETLSAYRESLSDLQEVITTLTEKKEKNHG